MSLQKEEAYERYIFEDLEDLLPPKSSYSISWNELELNSDGELRMVDCFERNPVSPTFNLNNNGRNGTVQEYVQEVQEREFSLGFSQVCESSNRHFDGGRKPWRNFPPIVENFLGTQNSGVKLAFASGDGICSVDDFERSPVEVNSWDDKVSRALVLNNNGGEGKALVFSEKAPESNHRSSSRRRQRVYPSTKCMHGLSKETPPWRSGPMGRKTPCKACEILHNSHRLLE